MLEETIPAEAEAGVMRRYIGRYDYEGSHTTCMEPEVREGGNEFQLKRNMAYNYNNAIHIQH